MASITGYNVIKSPQIFGSVTVQDDVEMYNKGWVPNADNILDLGSSSKKFRNVYAHTIVGDVIDPDAIVDTLSFNIASMDIKFSRSGAKTLVLNDGSGGSITFNIIGDMTISSSLQVPSLTCDGIICNNGITTPSLTTAGALALLPGGNVNTDLSLGGRLQLAGANSSPTQILLSSGATSTVASSPTFKVQESGDVTCLSVTATTINGKTAADLVTGPSSATANSIPRYNSTTGKVIKTTNLIIDDSDNVTGVINITAKKFVGRDNSANAWLLTGEIIGEAFQRFMLSGDGTHGWSDGTTLRDVLLKRNGANSLRIENLSAVKGNLDLETINSRTADNFVTGPTTAVNNKMVVFNSTTGRLIKSASWSVDSSTDSMQNSNQSTNTYMMEVKKSGSAQVEFGLTNEGDHFFGPGSATYDTLLQRSGVSTMALTDASSTAGSGTMTVGNINSGGNLNFSVPSTFAYRYYCPVDQYVNIYSNDGSPVGAVLRVSGAGTPNTYSWGVGTDGIHSFGEAGVPVDTYFYRQSAKTIAITNTSFATTDITLKVGTVNHQVQNITKTDITAAGVNQSGATTIAQYAGWITINAGTGGIKLGSFLVAGDKIRISNQTGGSINIYPNSTNQINALGASNPFSLGPAAGVDIRMYSSTQSYTY